MRAAPLISGLAGLCLVLSSLPGSPAGAAEPYAAPPDGAGALPAVDGLNAKVSAFGGAADGNGLYGGAGSVAVPLGHRFGLQIDGIAAGFDSKFQGDVTVAGTAAHLFWRDPSRGLLGAYGHYVHADAFRGVDVFAGAVEGALYRGRFTLEGVAGAEGGEVDTVFGSVNIDTRFFDWAQIGYYPTDDLKLSVGHSYILGENAALFSAEWAVDAGGRTMASLFARGSVSEGGDGAVLGGLRFYFGQRGKTLIRRHREDDPPSGDVSLTTVSSATVGSTTYYDDCPRAAFVCGLK